MKIPEFSIIEILIALSITVVVILSIISIFQPSCEDKGGTLEKRGMLPIITIINGVPVTNYIPDYECVMSGDRK